MHTGRDIVIHLLVDEDVPSLGHRENILTLLQGGWSGSRASQEVWGGHGAGILLEGSNVMKFHYLLLMRWSFSQFLFGLIFSTLLVTGSVPTWGQPSETVQYSGWEVNNMKRICGGCRPNRSCSCRISFYPIHSRHSCGKHTKTPLARPLGFFGRQSPLHQRSHSCLRPGLGEATIWRHERGNSVVQMASIWSALTIVTVGKIAKTSCDSSTKIATQRAATEHQKED